MKFWSKIPGHLGLMGVKGLYSITNLHQYNAILYLLSPNHWGKVLEQQASKIYRDVIFYYGQLCDFFGQYFWFEVKQNFYLMLCQIKDALKNVLTLYGPNSYPCFVLRPIAFRLPTHSCDAHRKFIWWSLLEMELKFRSKGIPMSSWALKGKSCRPILRLLCVRK